MILAGDVGGTNARLALYEPGQSRPLRQQALASASYRSLEAAVKVFLGPSPPRISSATFGIAGPVVNQRCKATNLPWMIDARVVARALGIPRVALVNDLVAISLGALTVGPRKLRVLSGGSAPKKKGENIAVIAAGTGLGEAALIWNGEAHVPLGTEGGHVDFAPRNALEFELLEFLSARFGGHVSYERVVAGPGIGSVYDFFVKKKKMRESKENLRRVAEAPDRNKEIVALFEQKKSVVAARVVSLFASLYGAEAGNLALKMLATGGVFVAGGIAARLADAMAKPFMAAFVDKGRFRTLLQQVPVAIVTDPNIGLAGSAHHAALAHFQQTPRRKPNQKVSGGSGTGDTHATA